MANLHTRSAFLVPLSLKAYAFSMAETRIIGPLGLVDDDDIDECSESGKHGKRGKRGHRGPEGPVGPTGPASTIPGPTGPTGSSGSGPILGDPNTQAYFGPTGVLTDDVDATMSLTDWQLNTSPGGAQAAHINRALPSAAFGVLASATGVSSFASGILASASGGAAAAFGISSSASGAAAFAEGNGTLASGTNGAHAEGEATVASGEASHAEGVGTSASNDFTHAEGAGSIASGLTSHAEGNSTVASGDLSHAEGDQSVASGISSHAQGALAGASRTGQDAHSSGFGGLITTPPTPGLAQASLITMTGETPGLAPGETVELALGVPGGFFILEDDKGYNVIIKGTMFGLIGASDEIQVSRQLLAVFRKAGTTTLAASGLTEQIGSVAAASWSITATVGAAPDRLQITFSTGITTAAVRVIAAVEFVEVVEGGP